MAGPLDASPRPAEAEAATYARRAARLAGAGVATGCAGLVAAALAAGPILAALYGPRYATSAEAGGDPGSATGYAGVVIQ